MPEAANAAIHGAPVITSETPGSFAWSVLHKRHPALIQQVRDAFPYTPEQHQALDALLEEITDGVIEPLPVGAHGEREWAEWGKGYFGRSWFEVPFLWAESYFYRKLLGAVGYFKPVPWQGIDPFAPFKRAELRGSAVAEELAALDDLADLPPGDQDRAVLLGALWGNRADLGFRISSGEVEESAGNLIVDDSAQLWDRLGSSPNATVCLVADNAGRELIPDLILIDHLLQTGRATHVVLHVKPYAYYVSDATMADVIDCLRRLTEAPGRAGQIGGRLWDAMGSGRLDVRAHSFSCAPLPYAEMPADLRADFAQATLTIFKGDLNYRRLVGDQLWPATTSFTDRTCYFPGSVIALRTLKSDVIVGLDAQTLATLEATEEAWRTSGTHAVIQGRP
ncbi:MAG: protein-glutamate O-methyltransferase family protein [Streptomycetaceae bacterium]|nr:protein-glutamate O-methyltransferase family protein [Streptomycetaceae bacterium]